MTFLERYQSEDTWYKKAIVMEIYHLAQTQRFKQWTLSNTADYFEVSRGLVSENLRLANLFHVNPKAMQITTREKALKLL